MKAVWGATPKVAWTAFLKGREQDEHSVRDVAHEDGGRKTGRRRRNRSARWIGRKIATRAGFTSLIRMQGQSTRVEIANRSIRFMFRAGHSDSLTMRSLTTRGAGNDAFV